MLTISALLSAALLAFIPPAQARPFEMTVVVTYYLPTGQRTYSGEWPREGTAACSWNFRLGQQLVLPHGRVVVCNDRGHLGSTGWVDLYTDTEENGQQLARLYSPTSPVLVLP